MRHGALSAMQSSYIIPQIPHGLRDDVFAGVAVRRQEMSGMEGGCGWVETPTAAMGQTGTCLRPLGRCRSERNVMT